MSERDWRWDFSDRKGWVRLIAGIALMAAGIVSATYGLSPRGAVGLCQIGGLLAGSGLWLLILAYVDFTPLRP